MKQTRLFARFMGMLLAFVAFGSLPAWASSYYSKVNATAVGAGKVYVSTAEEDVTEEQYATETSNTQKTSENQATYYLYAKADTENTKFEGWFDNAECLGEALATSTMYMVTVSAASDKQNAPTTTDFYAKFTTYDKFLMYPDSVREYVSLGAKDVHAVAPKLLPSDATLAEAITYTSSNENVAEVSADGTLTLKKNGTVTITASADGLSASYLMTVIDSVQAGVTQIGNGDFEDWRGANDKNHAPANWNSFETAEGNFASVVAKQQVAQVVGGRPGSDGLYCVDIYSRSVFGVAAQGNLTLGCINAGSTSATDAGNHNFSKIEDEKKSETIASVPSALKVWVKFVPGAVNEEHPYARVAATVHDAYNYITYGDKKNDNAENQAHAIAQAEQNFPACDWTELTIPFTRTGNMTSGQMYINVNISTNADPGQGQEGDHLYIDDVELVYDDPAPVTYDKYIAVTVNGTKCPPVQAPIDVTYNDNNTIDFNLKNFTLEAEGESLPVGNITLPGLAVNDEGDFSFEGNIQIEAGDQEGVDLWLGPQLGDIPAKLNGNIRNDYFHVAIDINVGYPVVVEVGDLASTVIEASNTMYTTFCAPFAFETPKDFQASTSAMIVEGVTEDSVLVLAPVSSDTIPANTPVIILASEAVQIPASGIIVKGTPVAGLLTGVYEQAVAPDSSFVLQNMEETGMAFYRVSKEAENVNAEVPAYQCYLTLPKAEDTGVSCIKFDNTITGIETVKDLLGGKAEIYDLAGRRLPALQKGINIVNGRKVLVK